MVPDRPFSGGDACGTTEDGQQTLATGASSCEQGQEEKVVVESKSGTEKGKLGSLLCFYCREKMSFSRFESGTFWCSSCEKDGHNKSKGFFSCGEHNRCLTCKRTDGCDIRQMLS